MELIDYLSNKENQIVLVATIGSGGAILIACLNIVYDWIARRREIKSTNTEAENVGLKIEMERLYREFEIQIFARTLSLDHWSEATNRKKGSVKFEIDALCKKEFKNRIPMTLNGLGINGDYSQFPKPNKGTPEKIKKQRPHK